MAAWGCAVTAATPTGAELRARRERLGLSEAWIEDALDETPIPRPFEDGVVCGNGYGETRRLSAEGDGAYGYYEAQIAVLRTAYAAALTAEEQRRAAALLTEPVAPEGVTVRVVDRVSYVSNERGLFATVWPSEPCVSLEDEFATPRELRFAADLADYRAAQHAAGEQQRKIDAVRAAVDAFKEADATYSAALDARDTARKALANAKREAGL